MCLFKDSEISNANPQYIDIYELKKYVIGIIKPDGHNISKITFKDLVVKLSNILPQEMKNNVTVAIIYVTLLHLTNEHNLYLTHLDNNNILISQTENNIRDWLGYLSTHIVIIFMYDKTSNKFIQWIIKCIYDLL